MKMITRAAVVAAIACVACAQAEMRTWTLTTGETVEGDYVAVRMDKVVIKNAEGKELGIPIDRLSREDAIYVELKNPPKLTVDFLEHVPTKQIDANSWTSNSGQVFATTPVFIMNAQFGARIKNKTNMDYHHELTIEIIVLTKQLYDPDKYHMIARSKSAPFVLSDANDNRHEYNDEKIYRLIYYNISGTQIRGEKPAERLILVWDERGQVVAYEATKKWLYENLNQLMDLPVGAWIDKKCRRVYPTQPVSWYD